MQIMALAKVSWWQTLAPGETFVTVMQSAWATPLSTRPKSVAAKRAARNGGIDGRALDVRQRIDLGAFFLFIFAPPFRARSREVVAARISAS